ncbi:MAG TPA: cell division protein ZipA C-terminal FtsZ-binding domain-containing protein, partial [Burkholderiaceae bacterium]|nr:cell division protein ZipA C-terminal FtsZ-binding domain-containing protein [Burkholderiaceae bacterium]
LATEPPAEPQRAAAASSDAATDESRAATVAAVAGHAGASATAPAAEARAAAPKPPAAGAGAAATRNGTSSVTAAASARTPASVARGVLSEHTDCIVEFELAGPLPGERVVSLAGAIRRAGSKPLAFEIDDGSGEWRAAGAEDTVRRLRAGVLMANRHGPLNAMEFTDFVATMRAVAAQLGATVGAPEMGPVLERARALDAECAELDAQIVLNVDTPAPLTPAQFATLARELGLDERGNNRYAALTRDGELLYSLALGERSNQLTLLLDLPRAPAEAGPWTAMVECARRCADRVGGRLVDDAGRALTAPAIERVERQLSQRYKSLAQAGLRAGSPLALRVFN